MELNSKCPYCRVGFTVMCTKADEFNHIDIMWSSEAGLQLECKDPEEIKKHIVPNPKYGTGFSLSEKMDSLFRENADKFYKDPSPFSKENTELGVFSILLGYFVRYSEYMDDKKVKEEIKKDTGVITEMYNEGKNLLEIIEFITEPDNDI